MRGRSSSTRRQNRNHLPLINCPNRIIKAPTPPGSEAMATMPAYGQQYQVVCVPNPAGGYTQVQISGGPQHPNSGLNANPCAPQKEGNVLSTENRP